MAIFITVIDFVIGGELYANVSWFTLQAISILVAETRNS